MHRNHNIMEARRQGAAVLCFARRFLRAQAAAISPMFALLLVPIAGSVAYAVELGGMYYVQRSLQNAADAAALAAASNNNQTGTGTTPQIEARAAAKPYGYVNGQSNVTVVAGSTVCPPGVTAGSDCYEAIITDTFPLSFSRLVGFLGSGGTGSQLITARAVATAAGGPGGGGEDICVWSLSPQPSSFTSNGGPRPDMAGCSLLSNGGMTCNGHNLNADYGIAGGISSGCGNDQVSGATIPADPYAELASNIPSSALPSCGGTFHQLSGNGNNVTVHANNRITGSPAWTGTQRVFCGDVQLTGNVTLGSGNTTIIIENGRLDLNGYRLQTTGNAAATVVFSGNNNATYRHYPMSSKNKSGTIDIKAPTSGAWSGVALYQDPAVTTNTSFTYAGNEPTWNITGLVYLPHADVTFSGVVNKAGNGTSCFVLVAYTVLVNGTGQILANTECASSGLTPPNVTLGSSTREKLVL